MIQKYSTLRKASVEIPVSCTFDKRPETIPADWYIFTAPRPLPGDETWRGSGGHGWHFAALDPKNERLQIFLSRIRIDGASLVRYLSEEEYRQWLEGYIEDKEELAEVLNDPMLLEHYKQSFIKEAEQDPAVF